MALSGDAMIDRMNAEREAQAGALERRATLIDDAQAFVRAVQYLKHARASKKRAGGRLSWRDAEAALIDRAATCVEMYERARKAMTPAAAA